MSAQEIQKKSLILENWLWLIDKLDLNKLQKYLRYFNKKVNKLKN